MKSSLLKKYNIQIVGNLKAEETLVFTHGFGSNQRVWRFIVPTFQDQYRIVLFDWAGSDVSYHPDFDVRQYRHLTDYANDFIEIFDFLELKQVHLIAHSVSCMIGTLVALKKAEFIQSLVFIAGSPRYINDRDYRGGLTQADVGKMLDEIALNYLNWVRTTSPIIMNAPEQPLLAEEFVKCLLALHPNFAFVTFRMILNLDCRQEVEKLNVPVLILQPQQDIFVPLQVGEYLHQTLKHSQLCLIEGKGHFPQMSCPQEVIRAIAEFLSSLSHHHPQSLHSTNTD
ncbi:MAG: alpha/beta hydrolase [Snowella sp.]|nr:alpha/beta hydrolase [Snowella sp.]